MATAKEQSIKITASSGLSEAEIKNLIKDAELHAEEDKKKKELVEARNMGDSLIYSTEKSIKDLGEKVDAATKTNIEAAVTALKKAMEGDNAEEIKQKSEELTQVSHKLAEAMYQEASKTGAQGAPGEGGPGMGGQAAADDDVVDADFEEVKDDKK